MARGSFDRNTVLGYLVYRRVSIVPIMVNYLGSQQVVRLGNDAVKESIPLRKDTNLTADKTVLDTKGEPYVDASAKRVFSNTNFKPSGDGFAFHGSVIHKGKTGTCDRSSVIPNCEQEAPVVPIYHVIQKLKILEYKLQKRNDLLNESHQWDESEIRNNLKKIDQSEIANHLNYIDQSEGVLTQKKVHQQHISDFRNMFQEYFTTGNETLCIVSPLLEGCWKSVKSVVKDIKNTQLHQQKVLHPSLMYTGIIDCIGVYRSKPLLMKFRSQKGPTGYAGQHLIELAALAGALNFDPQIPIQVDAVMLVFAYDSGSPADVIIINSEKRHSNWELWLSKLNKFWKIDSIIGSGAADPNNHHAKS